ncbi:hypothetical protein [Comamonas sp.]|uniref:hypothetical protein n=1 Tax=Comamonas sp. TaxID=34028 RepID=UPI00289E0C70|nr:hypothetical protein [Comamonas sp.]
MSTDQEKPTSITLEQMINSLIQQTTVLGVALGSVMKHISLNDPELANQIESDLFPLLEKLGDKLPDSRTQEMIDLLKTGITEGRRDGNS